MYVSPDWTESRATSWFSRLPERSPPGAGTFGHGTGMLAATRSVSRGPSEGRVNAAGGGGDRG